MQKKYVVDLTAAERQQLRDLVGKGKTQARKIQHAQILLKADQSRGAGWTDQRIAEAYGVSVLTVGRIRQRLVEHGFEDALVRRQSKQQPSRRKIDGAAEAKLIALACSQAPEGRRRWTIRLLADKMVELEIVDSVGRETVRKTLKKTN